MKKKLLILLFSVIFLHAKAQNWGGGIDQENFNWGFGFQYIASEYKIIRTANWQEPVPDPNPNGGPASPRLNSISSPLSAGFGIGFVLNYKLNKNLDLRSTPSIIFNDRLVNYEYDLTGYNSNFVGNFPDGKKQQKVSPVMVDLPLSIKLKSERRKDFRAYVLLGAKYSTDLGGNKKPKDEGAIAIERLLKSKKSYASYEAGLGFDLYFEYFKMSPEIKVSHSFGNVIRREGHPYDTPIDKAILRNFTFSLFFE
ncbi:outer membrane beta-barrel protein [Pedobacter xixiisoli]|uniref:Probable protein-translocating porin PorT n=1 Tax=Pedobacter xixiisoli TaxID=1476464 RepID=A0A285ZZD5_9SPHI|nr:outer membrane beta-barrel protein [Pedobacter xixiisoli]SOD15008.1 probable protein-translocating porin PorT [Pedobacter xixiisoli]